jgi:SnoaL-like domain
MSTASLDDRLDLRALVDEYALAVDGRDADRFAALFTTTGELAIYEPGEPEPVITYRGPEELRAVMDLLAAYSTTFHVMANHTCSVQGDSAVGQTYCLAHHLTESGSQAQDTLMLILYRDSYEKAGGTWRFGRREVMRQWTELHDAERARLAL